MLSKLSLKMVSIAIPQLLIGMVLGNMIFIYLGLIPLVYLLLGLILEHPNEVTIEIQEENLSVNIGEAFTISKRLKVGQGYGPIIIGESLPNNLSLVEGNNVRLLWKGLEELDENLEYIVKGTKRGIYFLDDINYTSIHSFSLLDDITSNKTQKKMITVKPKLYNFHNIRQRRIFDMVPIPIEARMKIGMPTTEFKEIRELQYGDSYKQINWKATGKSLARHGRPIVNVFEKEGKRIVWFFLDSGLKMALGSSLDNIFEYGVQGTLSLSNFYTDRKCMVGLCIYNSDKKGMTKTGPSTGLFYKLPTDKTVETAPQFDIDNPPQVPQNIAASKDFIIYPDLGKRQQYKIWKKMLDVNLAESPLNLVDSINSCKGYIKGTSPLFIIVTSVTEKSINGLFDSIIELKKYLPRTKSGKASILVFHISGYSLLSNNTTEEYASQILQSEEKSFLMSLRKKGIMVMNWNPSRQSLTEMLLTQVSAR